MGGAVTYSYGVFLPRICEAMNWAKGTVAGAMTVYLIMENIPSPAVGLFIRRFGPRKSIIFGNLLMVLSLASLSRMTEIWQLYLFFGLLAGSGWSFGQMIPVTTIANNWFSKRRALALSIVITGSGLGGLMFPPLMVWVISVSSWQIGWLFLAGTLLVLAVVIPSLIVKDSPKDIGEQINGVTDSDSRRSSPAKKIPQVPSDWKVRDALRTRALWLIIASQLGFGFGLMAMAAHQAAYLQDLGYSATLGATTLGIVAGMSAVGRLSYGVLGLKFQSRHIASVALAGMLVGILIFIRATTLPLTYIYAIIFGFSYGLLLVVFTDMTAAYYGATIYPQLAGWTAPLRLIGSSGPWIAGVIRDTYGSYVPALMTIAALLVIGLACSLMVRPPKPPPYATAAR